MSISPCRNAALRRVSSSSASISMPIGSNRTVWFLPIAPLGVRCRPRSGRPGRPTRSDQTCPAHRLPPAPLGRAGRPSSRRLLWSGRGALRRRPPGGAAGLVLGHVLLALLRGHLVEEHIGAV